MTGPVRDELALPTLKRRSRPRSRRLRAAGRTHTQAPVGGPAAKGTQAALAAIEARRTAWVRVGSPSVEPTDAASQMLASGDWIPLVNEMPLVQALLAQRRRFAKPLRNDAKSPAFFPNAPVLDTGRRQRLCAG